ncbi:YciI family protein [Actinotalea sp. M2MS4P-6]|uniref:YciI family protein n=1 Tax=Actinotalea sp. M2MS4P-6 TaxID=2983762 RepID=UPI0021E3B7A1|nr:YciI family protein [Actinotalea sp. M2MS4P-6]MCV2396439.1 YciI family protein [Actinotalea sp. M2MS4P-6]
MTHYLLAMYQPQDGIPEPEVLDGVMRRLAEVTDEMRAADAFVLSAGLHPASTATVVRSDAPLGVAPVEFLMSDGPFAEVKEQLGGFWLIDAPDLDAALGWARRIVAITSLPIEVRPAAGLVT